MIRVLIFGAIALAVALLIWVMRGGAEPKRRTKRSSVADLRRRLGELTHDPEVADRLVRAERERYPSLSEAALLRKTIKRLEADRR